MAGIHQLVLECYVALSHEGKDEFAEDYHRKSKLKSLKGCPKLYLPKEGDIGSHPPFI